MVERTSPVRSLRPSPSVGSGALFGFRKGRKTLKADSPTWVRKLPSSFNFAASTLISTAALRLTPRLPKPTFLPAATITGSQLTSKRCPRGEYSFRPTAPALAFPSMSIALVIELVAPRYLESIDRPSLREALPNVKDEPRRELARRVQDYDSNSVGSFRSSFGSTRRDRSRRWLWRLVRRGWKRGR
jgi:hypothetical protein